MIRSFYVMAPESGGGGGIAVDDYEIPGGFIAFCTEHFAVAKEMRVKM
jgi:hypothetical protein